ARDIRVPELITVVYVSGAPVFRILASAFDPVLESFPLRLLPARRRVRPRFLPIGLHWRNRRHAATHQVLHAHLVSTLESFPVGVAFLLRNRRILVFFPIVDIRRTMVLGVLARSFNPVMKSSPFRPAVRARGDGPWFLFILCRGW